MYILTSSGEMLKLNCLLLYTVQYIFTVYYILLLSSQVNFNYWLIALTVRLSCFPLPGDGSIYIRDDYLVIPAPKIDCAMAATGALILSGHAEHYIIGTLLQLQASL